MCKLLGNSLVPSALFLRVIRTGAVLCLGLRHHLSESSTQWPMNYDSSNLASRDKHYSLGDCWHCVLSSLWVVLSLFLIGFLTWNCRLASCWISSWTPHRYLWVSFCTALSSVAHCPMNSSCLGSPGLAELSLHLGESSPLHSTPFSPDTWKLSQGSKLEQF